MVRHLVDEYAADVNLTNGSFRSMLTIAIVDRNVEAIKFLVDEMKADINIQVIIATSFDLSLQIPNCRGQVYRLLFSDLSI